MKTLDGNELVKKGEAGKALGWAMMSSATGGIFSTLVMLGFSPVLASIALSFGPAEYFAISLLGITAISSLGGDEPIKGITSGLLGLLIATVGMDELNGYIRYSFGIDALKSGFPMVSTMIGLFAMAELFKQITKDEVPIIRHGETKVKTMFTSFKDYIK